MVRRKGEMTSAAVDRGWPFQVALEERLSMGDRYYTVHFFCEKLSVCPRGHGFYRDNRYFNVFCFAEREHAELFRAKFGGQEVVDVRERPKWWQNKRCDNPKPT